MLNDEELKKKTIEIRRVIHKNPELGFEEKKTASLIGSILSEIGFEVRTEIGETGVVGILKGKKDGSTIGLRADMDALPIKEDTTTPYTSQIEGVMHACGHDGHVAMLLGAAMLLAREKEHLAGNVKLIFQPGEETAKGALSMIADGVLDDPKVDAVIGIHLWPELRVGEIGIQYGPCMAAVDNFWVTVKGKSTHGAMPHKGADAVVVSAYVICALQQIVSRQTDPLQSLVLTVGTINGGYRRNIVADKVKFVGTVRTLDPEVRKKMPTKMEAIIAGVTGGMGCAYSMEYTNFQSAVVNEEQLTKFCEETLKRVLGPDKVRCLDKAPLTGEDFAYFAERVPATFLKVGCSNPDKGLTEPLHSTKFDFDEDALVVGAKALAGVTLEFLQ